MFVLCPLGLALPEFSAVQVIVFTMPVFSRGILFISLVCSMIIQKQITQTLSEALEPAHLDVINESGMHNVPKGSETHFKVVAVSEQFGGKTLVNRHRMINELLADQLAGGVHALSLQT